MNAIECTCILTDEQLARLQTVTKELNGNAGKKFTDQMTLQLAIGNPHLTEMVLVMLENYIADNINVKK